MLASKKTLSLLLLALHLTACGGGGGGGGSPAPVAPPVTESSDEPAVPQLPDDSSESEPEEEETTPVPSVTSKAEADSYYLGLASSSYDGNESDAELNETSALQVTDFFFGDMFGDTNVGSSVSASSAESSQSELVEQASTILANQQISSQLNKPSTQFKISASTIQVDNVEDCDSGTRHYKGEEDENGIGLLEVTYRNCRFGDLTYTGKGHFIYQSTSFDKFTNFYDGVTVYTPEGNFIWTGSIETSLYTDGVSELHNIRQLSLQDLSELKYSNYRITHYTDLGYSEWSGDIYFDALGKVTVDARNMIHNGERFISGAMLMTDNQVVAQVYFYSETYALVSLDNDKDGTFDKSVLLTEDMSLANVGEDQFVAADEIVIPSIVSTKEEADTYYLQLADDSYTGSRDPAPLNEISLLEWLRYLFGTEDQDAQFSASSFDSLPETSYLKKTSNHRHKYQSTSFAASQNDSDQTEIVDDLVACDSGTKRYQGELTSGIGLLSVTYNNCEFDGETYSGIGHYSEDPFTNSFTNYYDDVTVAYSGGGYQLTGSVEVSQYNLFLSGNSEKHNVTIKYHNSLYEERLVDYSTSYTDRALDDGYILGTEVTSESGTIYLSDLGFISFSTENLMLSDFWEVVTGNITFINGLETGLVEFSYNFPVLASLDYENDGVFDVATQLIDGINLTDQEIAEIEYVAADTISSPPSEKSEIIAYYQQLTDDAYTGSRDSATFDQYGLLEWLRHLFGAELQGNEVSALAVEKPKLNYLDVFSGSVTNYQSSSFSISAGVNIELGPPVIIDDLIACDSGSRHYQGVIHGTTTLSVNYSDCELSGMIYSGQGHELTDSTGTTNFYDGVTVTDSFGDGYVLTGSVKNSGFIFEEQDEAETHNVTVQWLNSPLSQRFVDYKIGYTPFALDDDFIEYSEIISLSGDFYFSDAGYFSVSSEGYGLSNYGNPSTGTVFLETATEKGSAEFYSASNILVSLDSDKDGTYDLATELEGGLNLTDNEINTTLFIDPDLIAR